MAKEEYYDVEVNDRKSFIAFVKLLREDLEDNPAGWENITLSKFLGALESYTEDLQGYYDNMETKINADNPDWSTFADILSGAAVYE